MTAPTDPRSRPGVVSNITDEGSIVVVWIAPDRIDGVERFVAFDHRSYHVLEAVEGDITGRRVIYHPGEYGNGSLELIGEPQ